MFMFFLFCWVLAASYIQAFKHFEIKTSLCNQFQCWVWTFLGIWLFLLQVNEFVMHFLSLNPYFYSQLKTLLIATDRKDCKKKKRKKSVMWNYHKVQTSFIHFLMHTLLGLWDHFWENKGELFIMFLKGTHLKNSLC